MIKKSKGYTLLEIIVAASLGAIIVIIGLSWAGSIGRIAINATAVTETGQLDIALSQVENDLVNSTHCNAEGKDAKIRFLDKSKIAIVTRSSEDATLKVAWWRFYENQLQKSTTILDAFCETTEPEGWSTLSLSVDTEKSGFYPVYNGKSQKVYTEVTCLLKFQELCDIPALNMYTYSNLSRQGFENTILLNSPTAGSSGIIYQEEIDITELQRPGQMDSINVQTLDTALRLSWSAPSSNLGSIEDYYIQYKESSSDTWSLYRDGVTPNNYTVVNNLDNGTSYDFKIAAVNEEGTGSYSEQVSGTPILSAEGGNTFIIEFDDIAYRVHEYTTDRKSVV